jgi:hypothetical protein
MSHQSLVKVVICFLLSLVVFVFLQISSSCKDNKRAEQTLINFGYTDIKLVDSLNPIMCGGGNEYYHTEFQAKNANGKQVSGVVCCGMFNGGCTIRF